MYFIIIIKNYDDSNGFKYDDVQKMIIYFIYVVYRHI